MDKVGEMGVFAEVARQGSFSGAARRLQLSPSAVSKLITRLEQRLAARLFNRTTRKLSLTEGGQKYYDSCVEILADIEAAEDILIGYQRQPRGLLKVTCSPAFANHQLVPLLTDFLARYPELEMNLHITGATVDLIMQDIDVAIRHGPLKDSSLVARKLGESSRIVCASPAYLERHGKPTKPADLAEHNCLYTPTSNVLNQWRFTRAGKEQLVEVSGSFTCDLVETLRDLALDGVGVVNLPDFIVTPDIEAGRLTALLNGYRSEQQPVHVVYPHRQHLPTKVRAFVDFLAARYSQPQPWARQQGS